MFISNNIFISKKDLMFRGTKHRTEHVLNEKHLFDLHFTFVCLALVHIGVSGLWVGPRGISPQSITDRDELDHFSLWSI